MGKILNRDPRVEGDRLAMLLASPQVERIIAEKDEALHKTRQGHVDAIVQLNAEHIGHVPTLDNAIERARLNFEAARQATEVAQSVLNKEIDKRSNYVWSIDHARMLHEVELLRTAPPMLDLFISEMIDQLESFYGKIGNRTLIQEKNSAHSLVNIKFFSTTFPAANQWYAAVLSAIRAAEAMKLESDVFTFEERLDALRESIPDPKNLEPVTTEVHPAVFLKT